jgi:DNA N-6-adenine-methyltransferase (Dam)
MPFTSTGFRLAPRNGKPAFPRSAKEDWSTPSKVYEVLDAEFHFDYDPCPLRSVVDGLSPLYSQPWDGKRVFLNVPYGPAIPKWLERAREAAIAVYLLPARVDTRWFHEVCLPFATEIRFIKGRLKFGDHNATAPFPSMVVIFRQ